MSHGEAAALYAHLASPAGRDDPYPVYAKLRQLGPLVGVEPGFLIATSFETVDEVLRDSAFGVGGGSGRLLDASMLNNNAPDHTRMRRLFAGAFTPRRVNGLADAITAQARELLREMSAAPGRQADLMADFAYRLPVGVICELLGVPIADRGWFRPVAADVALELEGEMTPEEEASRQSAAELLTAYFLSLVRDRRRSPGDDLISELAASDALAEDELIGNLALLLIAGFETTTNLIGNGVMTLLDHPAHLARLVADPALAERYVEEFLRFDPPVQLTSRVALEPTVVHGHDVDPGWFVMALIGSANRDETRFADADAFRPDRTGNTPISFGAGAHFCLGAVLARLEARIAFPLLLGCLPGLALAGEPVRRSRMVLRGYETMPVTWDRS
ncbi:cytochrome P450 [Allocatelliglobosispora scoriae]|uniref:Cytochrome P450 n=1 Tax=Allocatelliglobosispora scoriae TaxID=643052 RepID=A0A841C1T5_9ACTN|nr:cytochrome P450 [Allocatelliglobosispora scoriae]MBB5872831.1 cytochrome P450 [Allocatelliglobosispora scoriae]